MNDEQPAIDTMRPYISGADVMATWYRCTGWIPPSKDPAYVKKWMDFQLEFLEMRRNAHRVGYASAWL